MNTEQILESCQLPAVPMVATRILQIVENPLTTVDDLKNIILSDQALTTRVLKIANSAYYGTNREIDTVSEAIIIMGFDTIRNLAVAVASRDVYKNFGIIEQKLWEHALGVSISASIVSRYCKQHGVSPEEAIVAGLLHDIGKVVINNSQPTLYAELTQKVFDERIPFYELENSMLGYNHAQVGYLVAQKWGLPSSLAHTIAKHHECHNNDSGVSNEEQKGLCLAISLADALCVRLGIGFRGPMADFEMSEEKIMNLLGIQQDVMEEIEHLFKGAYIEEKLQFQE